MKIEHMAENKDLGETVHVQGTKEYEEVEIHFHSFLTSAVDGLSGQPHAAASLTRENFPCCPSNGKLGGPQSHSGPFK